MACTRKLTGIRCCTSIALHPIQLHCRILQIVIPEIFWPSACNPTNQRRTMVQDMSSQWHSASCVWDKRPVAQKTTRPGFGRRTRLGSRSTEHLEVGCPYSNQYIINTTHTHAHTETHTHNMHGDSLQALAEVSNPSRCGFSTVGTAPRGPLSPSSSSQASFASVLQGP